MLKKVQLNGSASNLLGEKVWSVPIGTVFPRPEWENAIEDEEYKRKVAIARTLPRNQSAHSVHPTSPPLTSSVRPMIWRPTTTLKKWLPLQPPEMIGQALGLLEGQAHAFRGLTKCSIVQSSKVRRSVPRPCKYPIIESVHKLAFSPSLALSLKVQYRRPSSATINNNDNENPSILLRYFASIA